MERIWKGIHTPEFRAEALTLVESEGVSVALGQTQHFKEDLWDV